MAGSMSLPEGCGGLVQLDLGLALPGLAGGAGQLPALLLQEALHHTAPLGEVTEVLPGTSLYTID